MDSVSEDLSWMLALDSRAKKEMPSAICVSINWFKDSIYVSFFPGNVPEGLVTRLQRYWRFHINTVADDRVINLPLEMF